MDEATRLRLSMRNIVREGDVEVTKLNRSEQRGRPVQMFKCVHIYYIGKERKEKKTNGGEKCRI